MKRAPGPLKRKVHIGDDEWQWQMYGGGFNGVKIRGPDNVTNFADEWAVLKMSEDSWYMCVENNDVRPELTPSHIKDYIVKHIL